MKFVKKVPRFLAKKATDLTLPRAEQRENNNNMSLAQRRTTVNTQPRSHRAELINISDKRRRFDTQRTILKDRRIDRIAKLVYLVVDDWAGPTGGTNGRCFLRQQKIADQLGVSLRSVENSIRKLAKFEYLVKVRMQRGNRYELNWALRSQPHQEGLEMAPDPQGIVGGESPATPADCGPEPHEIVGGEPAVLYVLSAVSTEGTAPLRPEPPCRCGGAAFIGITRRTLGGSKITKTYLCGCKALSEAGGWTRAEKLLARGALKVFEF